MINSLFPIIGIIVVVFIILKFLAPIVEGILTLGLIVVVFMICLNLAHGTPLLNSITPKNEAQVQQPIKNQEVSTLLQKLNVTPKQIKTFLDNSQSDIDKYDLAIKQAFAKQGLIL